jgi:hypothetical protein
MSEAIFRMPQRKAIKIRTYKGRNQADAMAAYQAGAAEMATQGYFPVSQSWAPGAYGCGSFLVALLLCFILVGVLVFIYMLIVKPEGTLTVTYALRAGSDSATNASALGEATKTCPQCAETVKAAAKICRFCRYEFEDVPAAAAENPWKVGTTFVVGSRVTHKDFGEGEVIDSWGNEVKVKFGNRTGYHPSRDLTPL